MRYGLSAQRSLINVCSRRFFGKDAKEQFLKNLSSIPASKHPRLVSDSDANSAMSVLIPLVTVDGRDSVLLTKRSIHLRSHRGEVCFPGGRMDPGETTTETALRETFEEIGVNAESVEIWGHLKSVIRRQADFNVTPIVGYISDERVLENLVVNSDEVQAVFTIPIDELIKKAGLTKFQSKRMKYTLPSFDSTEFKVHHNAPNEYLHSTQRVWGLSGVMLHQALTLLNPDVYKHDLIVKFF
ncbi:Nudix hydrolase 3 [Caenorhabditis elegans]|uniref:Nudix hydrolase 3 n=1 Tax=Caenorhabditis elegans TaxID=6239 RepID=NDX3_CAEEL|nr:Nudix hydrolase 3 [Caenorhabditis elegans]Q23236.2 RecName: Full=Nudix hydrolase 3 [Caenorhabditis elegans]CCD73693.1 Nudix hydrolase 3 [Caenorhabditis elegans]|eukprot:NP_494912.2 Nudix hydrolase 3 [Caenorhabditis elegans]